MTHHSKHSRAGHKTQNGVTLLGLLFASALVVIVALVAMKVVPAYMEYFSIKKVLVAMKQESLDTMSPGEIRRSFDNRATVSYITVVKGSDVAIEKTNTGTVLSVEYQVQKPLFGNISVLIDFSASSSSR